MRRLGRREMELQMAKRKSQEAKRTEILLPVSTIYKTSERLPLTRDALVCYVIWNRVCDCVHILVGRAGCTA